MPDPSPGAIIKLDPTQTDDAAAMLARAFFDYPLWTWLLPDEQRRAAILPTMMGVSLRYCMLGGETYTTAGIVRGVASWLPPGAHGDLDPDGTLSGYDRLAAIAGAEVLRVFDVMGEHQQAFRRRLMPERFWYLPWLGVEPGVQRSGIGGALLAPVLARAAAEGLPCYLETEREANVAYYEHRGFEVIVQDTVPEGGPPFWGMAKLP